jgi:hypothetical protein
LTTSMRLVGAWVTGSSEQGALRLLGAHIAGNLDLADAVITNDSGPALDIDRLRVDNSMWLTGARVTGSGEVGALRLVGAHIAGQLDLADGVITNDSGPALPADGLQIGSDMWLVGARVTGSGEVGAPRFVGAHIAGQLRRAKAKITNSEEGMTTLDLESAQAQRTVFFPVGLVCSATRTTRSCRSGPVRYHRVGSRAVAMRR